MQVSSIDSPSSHSSVDASPDTNISLPLIGNVVNIDTGPQTISLARHSEFADSNRIPILDHLRDARQSSLILLQKSEENQFISVLRCLSGLDELYYDEDFLKFLIKNNDPRKYSHIELCTSALYTQAAWYRAKNRILDLIYHSSLGKTLNISQGKMGLAVAITNLINNKIKHQSCLNEIRTNKFTYSPDKAKKTTKELNYIIQRAKKVLREYRRDYCYALLQRGINEKKIIENLSRYFSGYYSIEAIKNIFISLPEEKIKMLIQNHIFSSFFLTIDEMEESAFKIIRKPVPELFWNSLGKCSEQDWREFNKHFFLFLLSSWLSDPKYLFSQRKALKEAITTKKTGEVCQILADKLLQLSFRIGAQKVLNQILILAKGYELSISEDNVEAVQYALTELNETYVSVFIETHLPYLERKKVDWDLKTLEESQKQADLLNNAINDANIIKKRLPKDDNLNIKKFLDFIYAVLLHFRSNYFIHLCDLNNIAIRTIADLAAQQTKASPLKDGAQSLKRKRKEKHQQHLSLSKVSVHSQIESMSTVKEIRSQQQLLDDIEEIVNSENYQVAATQEQMLEHEEYRNILSSLISVEGAESSVSQSILALIEEKRSQECKHRTSQLVSKVESSENLASTGLRFFPLTVDSSNESETFSVRMLNFKQDQ